MTIVDRTAERARAALEAVCERLAPPPSGPRPELLADLRRDEGLRLKAYQDSVGVWTVGYGHAYVPAGTIWTLEQAEKALIEDICRAEAQCDAHIPWWRTLDPVRQDVMLNLMFNMGWGNGASRLSSFKNTLAKIQSHDFAAAAQGLLASKWAQQVGARAMRLAAMMLTGKRGQA